MISPPRVPFSRRTVVLVMTLVSATIVATLRTRHPNGDWSFFAEAAPSLLTRRGLLIYADFPDIQTGPLTVAVARLLQPFGYAGFRLAITLTCMAVLLVLARTCPSATRAHARLAVGGVVLAQLWPSLSFFGHLDDALVLLLACCCVALARGGRRWQVGVLAGLAIAVKPWSLFLLALALPRRGERLSHRFGPLLLGGGVATGLWAPFVLATPKTLEGLRPVATLTSDSVLSLLGLADGAHAPLLRVVQLVLVLGAAVIVHHRSGPSGVLWAGIACRLLLDPATLPYYTVGFVLGALVWEVYEGRGAIPWATLASALLLAPSWLVPSPTARAVLRLLACLGAVVVVLNAHRLRARSAASLEDPRPQPIVPWRVLAD